MPFGRVDAEALPNRLGATLRVGHVRRASIARRRRDGRRSTASPSVERPRRLRVGLRRSSCRNGFWTSSKILIQITSMCSSRAAPNECMRQQCPTTVCECFVASGRERGLSAALETGVNCSSERARCKPPAGGSRCSLGEQKPRTLTRHVSHALNRTKCVAETPRCALMARRESCPWTTRQGAPVDDSGVRTLTGHTAPAPARRPARLARKRREGPLMPNAVSRMATTLKVWDPTSERPPDADRAQQRRRRPSNPARFSSTPRRAQVRSPLPMYSGRRPGRRPGCPECRGRPGAERAHEPARRRRPVDTTRRSLVARTACRPRRRATTARR